MTSRLWGSLTLLAAAAQGSLAHGQDCCPQQVYRLEYQTVYEPQEMTAFRVEYETVFDEQQVTTFRQVYETQMQERRTIVRTPLVETAMRDEQFTQLEPVTTFRQQFVDQGCWANQQVCQPGRVTNRLRWLDAACVVDPATGQSTFQRAGLAWVPEQGPSQVTVQRVWRPNVVAVQIPQTTYVLKVCTRKVPVQTYRVVDQERVEQVPVQVCRMVPQTETVRTPRTVARQVPVKYVCQVPRTVVRKVPLCPVSDCCTTPTMVAPAPVIVTPAPAIVNPAQPAIPQTFAAPPAGSGTPTPANGAAGTGATGNGSSAADQTPQIDASQRVPLPTDELGAGA
jgi:hypothetical protein